VRTTLDIPEDLLERARQLWHLRTKSEAVIAGLEELIRRGRREQLRQLAGRVDLDLDLTRSRKRRGR
jgi:hypothetical protein